MPTAYEYLGVTPAAVSLAPQITPQLRMIARTIRRDGQPKRTRKLVDMDTHRRIATIDETEHAVPYGPGHDLPNSWPHYLASSDHPDAKRVLLVFYSVPASHRRALPVEAYCVAANVSPASILGIITSEIVRLGVQASTIIAAVNHPRVVQKSVEMALTDDGILDRNLLAKATGFLPAPKGSHTSISVQTTANASAAAPVAVLAPAPEQTTRTLANKLNELRGLPPVRTLDIPAAMPSKEAVAIEVESDEDEE